MARSSITQLNEQLDNEESGKRPRKTRTKAPPNETPTERFVRVGSIRVSAAIKALEGVGGLASPSYEYTGEQIDAALTALHEAFEEAALKLRARLEATAEKPGNAARFQF